VIEEWVKMAEELEAENLKLKSENIFSDKSTIEQLRRIIDGKNNAADRLHLLISELRNEITKMNKGMGRKNRKIKRLKITIEKIEVKRGK
jgi:hypothetical protein